jgi:hypothetical protein
LDSHLTFFVNEHFDHHQILNWHSSVLSNELKWEHLQSNSSGESMTNMIAPIGQPHTFLNHDRTIVILISETRQSYERSSTVNGRYDRLRKLSFIIFDDRLFWVCVKLFPPFPITTSTSSVLQSTTSFATYISIIPAPQSSSHRSLIPSSLSSQVDLS